MAIKILLVDDSETQLKFLEEGLISNGFEVETASNGSEAYKKIYTYIPDIVVADIVMPAIDGYQFCRMIKNVDETKKIPVILLSVLDKKIDNFWGKKAGAHLPGVGLPAQQALDAVGRVPVRGGVRAGDARIDGASGA